MKCQFYQEKQCKLVEEMASRPFFPERETCIACQNLEKRVNIVTISIAKRLNPDLDISGSKTGTTLHGLLSIFFQEYEGCKCQEYADILDIWTPEYIKKNINRVIKWLEESARKRKIPFSRAVTKYLILATIRKS